MPTTENALADALSQATIADADIVDNFAAFPLFAASTLGDVPSYLRLDEALATGRFTVTEVSEGGHVPELLVRNELDRPVLLLDGEQLSGAKQNRIVNLTILVGAASKTVIPVSCVEQGRWGRNRPDFEDPGRVLFHSARSTKAAHVSESLRTRSTRHSDQGALWSQIADKQARTEAPSPTSSVDSVYEKNRTRVEDLVAGLKVRDGQTGALFAIDGRPVGLELFDSASSLRAYLPKLARGYALDAFDRATPLWAAPSRSSVERFLDRVRRTPAASYPGVGLGEDLRLEAADVAGGALILGGSVVHAGVFDLAQLVDSGPGPRTSSRPRKYRWN